MRRPRSAHSSIVYHAHSCKYALGRGRSEGRARTALGIFGGVRGEGFGRGRRICAGPTVVAAVLVTVLISPSAAVTEPQPCEMHSLSLSACLSLYVCACLLLLRAHSSAARESLR